MFSAFKHILKVKNEKHAVSYIMCHIMQHSTFIQCVTELTILCVHLDFFMSLHIFRCAIVAYPVLLLFPTRLFATLRTFKQIHLGQTDKEKF